MTRKEMYALMTANPAFHLATLDEREPRVRGMLLYRADDGGILFHTGEMKDLRRQLCANPGVELCFIAQKSFTQLRVRGKALLDESRDLKEEIVNSPGREFLKPWVEAQGYDMLKVYRIAKAQATTWSMAENFAPKYFVQL